MSEIGNFFRAVRDDVVSRHDRDIFSDGYKAAADVALIQLRGKIDRLRKEIKSGADDMREHRALLLVELTELKDDLEQRLREFAADLDAK
jgi:hypothetical protein